MNSDRVYKSLLANPSTARHLAKVVQLLDRATLDPVSHWALLAGSSFFVRLTKFNSPDVVADSNVDLLELVNAELDVFSDVIYRKRGNSHPDVVNAAYSLKRLVESLAKDDGNFLPSDVRKKVSLITGCFSTNPVKATQSKKGLDKMKLLELHDRDPPDDFRSISVTPSPSELTSTSPPYLRPNIVEGTYRNPDHYLDVQFRLTREDYVGPLREAVTAVRGYVAKDGVSVMRGALAYDTGKLVYENVRVVEFEVGPRGPVLTVQFDVSKFGKSNWVSSKR